jgi:Zn-finger nucleic acid-binding protein
MIILDLDDVEIDYCHECSGCWLDAGELELILSRTSGSSSKVATAVRRGRDGERTKNRCPVCRHRMRIERIDVDGPIDLERCPRGHGLWLARDVMRSTVLERAAAHGPIGSFLADLFRANSQIA